MALEKNLFAIAPTLFTADGGADGKVTVPNACDFKVKQKVKVSGTALEQLDLEVKRVISDTEMFLGPQGGPISDRADLSAYTTAAASFVFAIEQKRPSIPFEEFTRATYEEEPTVAYRNILVDKLGRFYATDNPLPVQLSDGSISIGTVNAELEVQLSHLDDDPDAGDVHDSVRIGDGEKEVTATDYGDSKNVIDTAPFYLSVSRGKYPGFATVNVYGRNLEIDVANEEEINPLGTTFIPATAAPINILSTSASDDSAGSGARELTIKGLDSNYDEIEEVIALDGISQVTTVASFLRVNSVEVTDVGGSGSNVGIIVGFHGLLEFLFTIQEEDNKHLSTFYTVPAGKTARLTSFFASVAPKQTAVGIKEGEIALHATNGSNGIFVRRFSLGLSSRATAPFTIEVHENFPEMTDIRVIFIANSNNSKVTAGYEIILEDNP